MAHTLSHDDEGARSYDSMVGEIQIREIVSLWDILAQLALF